jgi:uncharacterized protein
MTWLWASRRKSPPPTSNLIIRVTALAGTRVYLAAGLIDPGLAGPIVLGIVIGTRVLVRLRNEAVRRFLLVVLFVLGAQMLLRELGVRL